MTADPVPPESAARPPWQPQSTWQRAMLVVGLIVAYFAMGIVGVLIAAAFGIPLEEFKRENGGVKLVVALTMFFAQIALVIVVQRFVHRRPLHDLGFRGRPLRDLGLGFVIGVAVSGVQTLVGLLFAANVSIRWMVPTDVPILTMAVYYVMALVLLLTLNSLSEELVFRAYPIEQLVLDNRRPLVALVVIAVVFSAMHNLVDPFDPAVFLARTLWALLFSLLYYRTRSVWLISGTHNGANFIPVTFFADDWRKGGIWELSREAGPLWSTMVTSVVVFGVAMLVLHRCLAAGPARSDERP